jgi:hypothetical protein
LQAIAFPVPPEANISTLIADVVAGLLEPQASRSRLLAWLNLPITPKLAEAIVSKASEQNIVRRLILIVQLKPIAFKPLRTMARTGVPIDLICGRRDRKAEDP